MATNTNQILEKIENVFAEFSGKDFSNSILKQHLKLIKPIQTFYDVNTTQAVILSIIIELGMRNEDVTINTFLEHFNGKLNHINLISNTVQELIKKGYVTSKTTGRFTRAITHQTFHLEEIILNASIHSNKDLLKRKPMKTLGEFLDFVKSEFKKREEGEKDGASFVARVIESIQENKHIKEVEWLSNQKEWTEIDKTIFLATAVNHMIGKKFLDLEYTIKQVTDIFAEQFAYRQTIVKKTNPMVIQEYLEYSEEEFIFDEFISLTEKSLDEFLTGLSQTIALKEFKPSMGQVISPESIKEEILFYNTSEERQIETIKNVLNPINYSTIASQLSENNLGLGVNILFHGYAGTGKTATVKQLAKHSNRHVFMVDIEKIQSRWVGESEKNLKKVFNEYQELSDSLQITPILLFNEADAVIGKRVEIRTSTDKSFNTLQSLLLQELEDFKGISFSTTNLANQLDKAFERRFLYKVEFEKPNREIQQKILKNSFPNIQLEMINSVISKVNLTGGQISNVKKKLLLQSIVEGITDLDNEFVQSCLDELSLEARNKPIGFNN